MKYDRDALIVMLNTKEQADKAEAAAKLVKWERDFKAWKRDVVGLVRAAVEAYDPSSRNTRFGASSRYDRDRDFDPPEKPSEHDACSRTIRERNRISLLPVDKRGCVNIHPKDAVISMVPCHDEVSQ